MDVMEFSVYLVNSLELRAAWLIVDVCCPSPLSYSTEYGLPWSTPLHYNQSNQARAGWLVVVVGNVFTIALAHTISLYVLGWE